MRLQLELDLPQELVDPALEEKALAKAREEIVLELFARRKLPGGRSARLLGLTKRQFMQLCQQRGVALVDYTAEDLAGDLSVMERLSEKRRLERSGADR